MPEQLVAPVSSSLGSSVRSYRIESIDVVRGLLMVLMALDHVRDYFTNAGVDPVDPVHSWPALFGTRWVTHLCAPGFIFLAGVSAYFQRQRKDARTLGRFLFTRGLWLIFLEVTVVSLGWSFAIGLPMMQVIWAIGASMVVLAGLQFLPVRTVGFVGIMLILFHNLLDPIRAQSFGHWKDAWLILHQDGLITYHGHALLICGYPLIPWIGVMALGYRFGALIHGTPGRRQLVCAIAGVCSLTLFVVLRLMHGYGDPLGGWQHLSPASHSVMSFFSVEKYPPSLHYLLATLGINLLLLALADRAVQHARAPRIRAFFDVYGRVPFFFYILHIYLIHGLALLTAFAVGANWHYWLTPDVVFFDSLPGWGYGLPVIYAVWIFVVLVLYLPSRWFRGVKDTRRDWWLSYL
jgi:uncharacterized membrane protein